MTAPARGGGGAATAGGIDYQARVGTWVSVLILANDSQSVPWQLPPDTRLESFICEADRPVDDIVIRTSSGGLIFIQAKRRTDPSRGLESPLGSAVAQFVRQFHAGRDGAEDPVPLDRNRDRLVLATGVDTPESVRIHLQQMIGRLAHLDPRDDPSYGATKRQQEVFAVFSEQIDAAWQETTGRSPSPDELRAFLRFVQIHWLTVDPDGTDEQFAKFVLRSLLRDPNRAHDAWNALKDRVTQLMTRRGSGINRGGLLNVLSGAGIALRDTPAPPRITGARLHDVARDQFATQLKNVAWSKYDSALYVPRTAMAGLGSRLAEGELSFRETALALIERLRAIDPPHGRDAREALVRARLHFQSNISAATLEKSVAELKSVYAFDQVDDIVRRINAAVRSHAPSQARFGFDEVIKRINALRSDPAVPASVRASLEVVREAALVNPTAPITETVSLKSVLRLLPSEHYDDYKPVTLANDLIRSLADSIDWFRRRCIAVTAAAGDGKTNVICALGEALLKHHPAVLIDVQQILTAGDVERAVKKALRGIDFGEDGVFAALAPGLHESRRRLFILIDGLDESQDVGRLNALLRDVLHETEESRLFVVVACRDLRWLQYEETTHRHLAMPVIQLKRFHQQERDAAIPLYMTSRGIDCRLSPEAKETLRAPLLLRLFADTYAGESLGDVHDLRPFDVFREFLDHALEKIRVRSGALNIKEPVRLLYEVALKIWNSRSVVIDARSLGLSARDFDSPSSTFNELRNEGILRTVEGEKGSTGVRFVYDELAEFAIARILGVQLSDRQQAHGVFIHKVIDRLNFVLTIGVVVFLDRDIPGMLEMLFEAIRNDGRTLRRYPEQFVDAFRAMKGSRFPPEAIETLAELESVLPPSLKPKLAPVVLELLQYRSSDPKVVELGARILEIGGLVLHSSAASRGRPSQDTPALPPARYHYSTAVRLAALTVLASSDTFSDDGLVTAGVRRLGQSELAGALETIRALDDASDAAVLRLVSQLMMLPTPEYRVYSGWLLRSRYGAKASEIFLALLLDEQTRVHRYAVRTLRQRRAEPELVELILERLEKDQKLPPWYLTQLLAVVTEEAYLREPITCGAESRIAMILNGLTAHRSASVRMTAFQALLKRAGEGTSAAMRSRIAADPDPSVRTLVD